MRPTHVATALDLHPSLPFWSDSGSRLATVDLLWISDYTAAAIRIAGSISVTVQSMYSRFGRGTSALRKAGGCNARSDLKGSLDLTIPGVLGGRTKRWHDSVIRKSFIVNGQSELFEVGHGLIVSTETHLQQSRVFRVHPMLSCLLHLRIYYLQRVQTPSITNVGIRTQFNILESTWHRIIINAICNQKPHMQNSKIRDMSRNAIDSHTCGRVVMVMPQPLRGARLSKSRCKSGMLTSLCNPHLWRLS
jgi:hypothetical protein